MKMEIRCTATDGKDYFKVRSHFSNFSELANFLNKYAAAIEWQGLKHPTFEFFSLEEV